LPPLHPLDRVRRDVGVLRRDRAAVKDALSMYDDSLSSLSLRKVSEQMNKFAVGGLSSFV
jgi:hypothetical protein